MQSEIVRIRTGSELITDLTAEITRFCRSKEDGLCHVFVPHATAGVALIERPVAAPKTT